MITTYIRLNIEEDRNFTYNVTMRRVGLTIVAVGKKWVLRTYAVCLFVALGIRHSMLMRHVVTCPVLLYTVFHVIS